MPVGCLTEVSLEPLSLKLLLFMFSLYGVTNLDNDLLLSVFVYPKWTGKSDSPALRSTLSLDGYILPPLTGLFASNTIP